MIARSNTTPRMPQNYPWPAMSWSKDGYVTDGSRCGCIEGQIRALAKKCNSSLFGITGKRV